MSEPVRASRDKVRGGSLHESYVSSHEIKTASERSFGLTVGGILAAIGLYRWVLGLGMGPVTLVLLLVGGALVVLGLVLPRALVVPNRLWTKLGLFLFKVVNPVIMFLIFAVTIVPIGLIMRLRGRDLLRLRRDPEASTYWIERSPPGPDARTMTRQF